ncbi:hypothetical protein RJ639_010707 [Escallonia herrerae]|uniref:Protein FAR1-RELATED SEQUENCE n=1 Tax=Escallonia herrerae TaxID=1293975 RepID=A0AA89ARY2_9ASTE|nr:hypothetical protein RJ639_010707 [Escallonia herrerae]
MVDIVDDACGRDGGVSLPSKSEAVGAEADTDLEPHDGIEFESHEAAYSFYQEYAKSMGFTTSIKNSRRSKKSKEFIDAKFACSRYGFTPESDGGSSRRPSVKKTDCKASMHVKRKRDGKWYIHEFVKEHNHELLPALAYHFRIHRNVKLAEKSNMDILLAVSERTRKMYVQMSRQSGGCENFGLPRADLNSQCDKGQYEEEAIADFDSWHKQPALKSPSPWEKQMSTVYTHAVFKKFQVEVLGIVGCHPKKEREDGAKGSLSEESYNIAFRALDEALKTCVNVNNKCVAESSNTALCLREVEEENQGIAATKSNKKKSANKKRKVQLEPEAVNIEAQDSLQQMENLSSAGITLNGYYGTQQNVQGLLQLNLMEPPNDGYYVDQQSMQGLGQLNSVPPNHDGFFGAQQSMHGMGHLDFRPSSFSYGLQGEPNLRSTQLHGDTTRGV